VIDAEVFHEIADVLGFPSISGEERVTQVLDALASKGIVDLETFMNFGVKKFQKTDFPPFGKGAAIAGIVLGVAKGLFFSKKELRLVADKLGFQPQSPEEKNKQYLEALATHGVVDRFSLFALGTDEFILSAFPPYGKGTALVSEVLGRSVKKVTIAHLGRLAEIVGLPQLSEETKKSFRSALAANNIVDFNSLVTFGVTKFAEAEFLPYGKGRAFMGAALDRTMRGIRIEDFRSLAHILGWSGPTIKTHGLQALSLNGITDRKTLYEFGTKEFLKADFPPFGKGSDFARIALERTIGCVTLTDFRQIADKVGFSEIPADELIYCRGQIQKAYGLEVHRRIKRNPEREKELLSLGFSHHGIVDRISLFKFGPQRFKSARFGVYKGGESMAKAVLNGETGTITSQVFHRLADIVGFPDAKPGEIHEYYRQLLSGHEITDRYGLMDYGVSKFMNTAFYPFHKGRVLAGWILEEGVGIVTMEHLSRVAKILGLPQLSEYNKKSCIDALGRIGIVDRKTMMQFEAKKFRTEEFPPFGKANAFVAAALGEPLRNVNKADMGRIADALGFPDTTEEDMRRLLLDALFAKGIVDRPSLIAFGISKFMKTDFPPFGKGAALMGVAMRRRLGPVSIANLNLLADRLGW